MRAIAGMAEAAGVGFCPHNPMGPLTNSATLQIAACTPNFYLLETMVNDVPWRGELSDEEVFFENGGMKIPSGPGLAVALNESGIEKHPPRQRHATHFRDNFTDFRPKDAEEWFRRDGNK